LIVDARDIPKGKVISSDICILGAGVAGLTLASELRNLKYRVSLIESGGLEPDKAAQSLFWGENIGHPYYPLDTTRVSGYGGTSHRWLINLPNGQLGVRIRCMDPIDFKKRAWVPHSGWPFGKSDLDPYYHRAHMTCRIGPYGYQAAGWEDAEAPCLPFKNGPVETTIFQFAERKTFHEGLRDLALGADNIKHYIHGNGVEIITDEHACQCTEIKVACLNGKHFYIKAQLYILAMGALEIPRLMLLSNKVQKHGLGNQHDLVGRFFMEHPHLWSGIYIPADEKAARSTGLYRLHDKDGTPIMGKLTVGEQTQKKEKLLNYSVSIHPEVTAPRPNIAPRYKVTSWPVIQFAEVQTPPQEPTVLKHLINGPRQIMRQVRRKMKLPATFFKLNHMTEQSPNPQSRIRLSNEPDPLGRKRIQLDWRLTPADMRSIIRSQEIIDTELRRAGLGRLRMEARGEDDVHGVEGGWHHMGTTRMHTDPKQGVVDADCRVHSVPNLFIAGPSVFPTCGYANPVLTIVALSIRLADKIKTLMN
jgi:choline dehydrogenase-like flavoprotein